MKQSNQYSNKLTYGKPLRHIFSVSFIVALAIFTIAMLASTFGEEINWGLIADLKGDKSHFSMSYYNLEPYIALFGGFIGAFLQFRYLHSKKHAYTILSFPVKRNKMFLRDAFIPLGTMIFITLIIKIGVLLVNISHIGYSFELYKLFTANTLLTVLPLVFSYTVTVWGMLFTGRTVEGVAASISGILLPSAVFSFIDGIFSIFLHGYSASGFNSYYSYFSDEFFTAGYTAAYNEITRLFTTLDPMGNFLMYSGVYCQSGVRDTVPILGQVIKCSIWIGIFTATLILMGKYFEKRYKPEFCGVRGKSRIPVILSSFVLPLNCIQIFLSYEENQPISPQIIEIFMVVIAGIVMAIILNIIICRGVKKILCGVISSGAIVITTLLVILIGSTGCFGYSSYVPETQEIEKAKILLPFEEVLPVNGYNSFYATTPYEAETPSIKFTSEKDINILRNIHLTAVNTREKQTSNSVTIIYTLKNGKEIPRCYNYISTEVVDEVLNLHNTDRLKEFYKIVLNQHEAYNPVSTTASDWRSYTLDFFGTNDLPEDVYSYYRDWYPEFYYTYDLNAMCSAKNLTVISKDSTQATFPFNNFESGQIDALKKAIYEDLCALSPEQLFTPKKQLGVIILSPTVYSNENDEYYLYSSNTNQLRISITSDMKKSLLILTEMGLNDYFINNKEIAEAHTVNIKDAVKWYTLRSSSYIYSVHELQNPDLYIFTFHSTFFAWDNYNNEDYWDYAKYLSNTQADNTDGADNSWINTNTPIQDMITVESYDKDTYNSDYYSDIIKAPEKTDLTPKEAEKLQEDAFMTYNIGDNGRFLAIKYTDGSTNLLVIPS